MDAKEFRKFGYAAVDFIADYIENVHKRPVLSSVEPGYLHDLLPSEMPENSESWEDVMNDLNSQIIPGLTHWQSNNFHAYFLSQTSFPSIVGEMVSAGLGIVSLNWTTSPAATELEVIVVDWLAKFLDLPKFFLNSSDGNGGGILQNTASEAMLSAILSAREDAVARLMATKHLSSLTESKIRGKLIMYTSDQCNCCVEKVAKLAAVSIRLLQVDSDFSLRGETLQAAIQEDRHDGKFPFACVATFGTTGLCAFDNLLEIGPICRNNQIWLHIDAAYAGSALCCPEFRLLMQGIEYSDSFGLNLHKWMLVNMESSVIWYRDTGKVTRALSVDQFSKHAKQFERVDSKKAPEYQHWEITFGHRFRSMKVWFTFRIVGAVGIRENIRRHVRLARKFANLVKSDTRFEIVGKPTLSLVCFRLKGSKTFTNSLANALNECKKIYLIESDYQGKSFLRFVVNGLNPSDDDIKYAWNEIVKQTNEICQQI